ncbi:hypothetical protein HPULCUR_005089 [Helicostylum pulchrum]|uniref:Uncharacterized protein n=1 Tax=Helicostylum pulchrum TaxID=562976 RepID=A0ABP9Y062_9FUNG
MYTSSVSVFFYVCTNDTVLLKATAMQKSACYERLNEARPTAIVYLVALPKPKRFTSEQTIDVLAFRFETASKRVRAWLGNRRYTDKEEYVTSIVRKQQFAPEETSAPEVKFGYSSYPSSEDVNELAAQFGTTPERIKVCLD